MLDVAFVAWMVMLALLGVGLRLSLSNSGWPQTHLIVQEFLVCKLPARINLRPHLCQVG